MFGLSAAVRVYLAKQPADMRKSFDGLAALASGSLALDPLSGHLFVFVNKRRDRTLGHATRSKSIVALTG
jgi:transposase